MNAHLGNETLNADRLATDLCTRALSLSAHPDRPSPAIFCMRTHTHERCALPTYAFHLCLSLSRCVCLSPLCISLARPSGAGGVSSPSVYMGVRQRELCLCVCKCVCLSNCLSAIEGGSKERESARDMYPPPLSYEEEDTCVI